MNPTASTNNEAAIIDEGWVEKVFIKTVEAEERVILMEKCLSCGVGLLKYLTRKSRNASYWKQIYCLMNSGSVSSNKRVKALPVY